MALFGGMVFTISTGHTLARLLSSTGRARGEFGIAAAHACALPTGTG
jgi:hypothetical protein